MRNSVLAVTLLLPFGAQAGGVFVGESGSQAMERAGAFVAKADDPSALWLNPAGLVKAKKIALYVGANLLNYSLSFRRAGTYPNQMRDAQPSYVGQAYPTVENEATFQPIPTLGAAFRLGRFAVGAGVYAPAAVPGRDFPCASSDQFCQMDASGAPAPQRYDVVDQKAMMIYPSLAFAARLHDKVDLGARASWGLAHIQARNFPWALPNAAEDPLREGDFSVDVKDNFMPTFGVGLLVRPIDALEIGVSYASMTQVRAKGTGNAVLGPEAAGPLGSQPFLEPKPDAQALCGTGGTMSAIVSCVDFDMPQSVSLGVRYVFHNGRGGERADVELDGKWENWSQASDDIITVDGQDSQTGLQLRPVYNRHGFEDTFAVRLGGSYNIDLAKHVLSLRGGLSYDTAAAPPSWTRVDKDGRARTIVATGVAYEIPGWRFDLGFGYVHEGSQTVQNVTPAVTVDSREQPDVLQPSLFPEQQRAHPYNAGTYSSSYLVGLLGVTAMF
jgi:long-chain fatty acid transport protein